MRLVKNEKRYWEFIRNLRNDPEIKVGFIEQGYITQEQQIEYMSTHNDSYYVCLFKGFPVGYVGDIQQDIRLASSPDCKRRGVGSFMLREFMKKRPGAYAKVLIDNEPSIKLFESVGFKWTHSNVKFHYYVKR